MKDSEHEIDALLVHDRFVRSLAHSLVADAATADDVAQDAWLAGLKGGVAGLSSFPRWVSGTVRNLADRSRRGARRRAEREERAARAERVPSAAEVLERESVRERLVAAVLALDEPYRATLLLRYFEGLSAREIARDLGASLETVRTREKRALELLRTRLDREYGGDGRAWGAALLPFARLSSASLSPLGLLAMTLQTKLAVGVAVLAVAAVLFVSRRGAGPTTLAEAPSAMVAVLASPPETTTNELQVPEPAGERVALAAAESSTEHVTAEPFGSLLVRVTWSDHTPASGVHARVAAAWSSGDPPWNAPEAVTDATGEFRLAELAPGTALVMLDRGDGATIEVEAGAEAVAEIALERGFDAAGVVLDPSGQTVGGADVWLSFPHGSDDGFVVAQSSADGRFSVRSCVGGTIGARAPAFAPSLLQSVRATEGAQLELELVLMGPGGEITGTVFDPEGSAVPSAWVWAGQLQLWQVSAVPVGGAQALTGLRALGQETRTDAEGRYRVRGLAPGACPLVVRAEGFGLARAEAQILEGGSTTFDVHLAPGVTLEGRVVDAQGLPLEAELRVDRGDMERALGSHTSTDANGVFVLAELAPGEFEVLAESKHRRARATLHGAAGETLRWDVVLGELGAIRGRLVDERGAGVAGWHVLVEDDGSPVADACSTLGHAKTDAEGRFVVEGLGAHAHRLEAHPEGPVLFSPAVAAGVFPERDELVLRVDPTRLPSVRIVGAVLDQDGQPVPSAQLRLTNLAFGRSASASPAIDGSFDLGPYPSGPWSLSVKAAERADCPELLVGPHELAAGETWDCGALVLQPGGALHVRTSGAAGLAPTFVVLQGTTWRGRLHVDGDAWRSDPLAPGSYRLAVRGPGVVAALVPFEIESGETSELALPLAAGAPLELRLLADPAGPYQRPVLRLRDASGASVIEEELFQQRVGGYRVELALVPGVYHAEAWLAGGPRAEARWTVGAGGAAEPLVLELR
ncbi:MAG: sigma-70 family RNA polymerase sigma factor [Planctomycetes bacterium]|nr:sigma-70 family RNA polymerase sigma factor [Planctomycetota bacterium]